MKIVNTKKNHIHLTSSGFTLIEVLLTLAIVGVLSKISLETYQDYTENAKVKLSKEQIAAMSAKISLYWEDAREYPDSLADVGMAGMLDPWDRPYRYLNLDKNGNGGARRDKNLNPLNSDFDLYSTGKDGETRLPVSQKDSLDDVLRANDGRFIDLAKNY